ncbi:hypothetical protein GGR21_001575 [Dysgonomonas hofstadii]|uniref:DUF4129 domain-containing protein n=1 Tax=Dysgonomonas hofstadii TaxID=637886 RepID=A0A840CI90_9BACT|nr:hypothetical protein [Dysgonomonas hofstadii]MBB4035680.1 hypothetical protein [Dysgonomonas hofstadii]
MLLLLSYLPVRAQSDTIPSDTAVVTITPDISASAKNTEFRVPDKEKIEEYQKDSRFDYSKKAESGPSAWDMIKYRIMRFFGELFGTAIDSGVPGVIVILLIVLIICFIVLKVLGVDYRTVLGRKKIDTPEIDIYTENVHEMDFDTLISNALKNKDYRLVVRFLYLKNLKALSDKEIIQWNANKTNYSYQFEISSSSLRSKFLETTLIFDYVWYGEFPVNETQFSGAYDRLNTFNKMIADER